MTKNGKKSNVVSIESIPPPVFLSVCYCYLHISVVEDTYPFDFLFFSGLSVVLLLFM